MKIIAVTLLLALAACSTPTFEDECEERGFKPATPEFDRCLIKLETSVKLQERDLRRQLYQQNEFRNRTRGY